MEADFEEKEYETAALGELTNPSGSPPSFAFSAGQVLETILGYDAAAAPSARHVIWRVLQAPRPPGLRLLPSLWSGKQPPADRLPVTPVTLVLQFKRPEYMIGPTAAQWGLWRQPYFRFQRSDRQQRILAALERSAAGDALIRYAAPAFWQVQDLETAHLRSEVLLRSGFVSPASLTGHRWWTYDTPGTSGRANRRGDYARFESIDDLLAAAFDRAAATTNIVPRDALGEHVVRLGAAAAEAMPSRTAYRIQRWAEEVGRREPELDPEAVRRIGAIAMLSTLTSRARATWVVTGMPAGTR